MRKLLCLSLFALICGGAFAQARQQGQPTIEDVLSILDKNFNTYPWVYQILADKNEDTRQERQVINRMTTKIPIVVNGEEKEAQSEMVYVLIIKNGYRYDLTLQFMPEQRKGAKRAKTVWNNIRTHLMGDLSDFMPKTTEAAAQD